MSLEATMIVLDNSAHSLNGDFPRAYCVVQRLSLRRPLTHTRERSLRAVFVACSDTVAGAVRLGVSHLWRQVQGAPGERGRLDGHGRRQRVSSPSLSIRLGLLLYGPGGSPGVLRMLAGRRSLGSRNGAVDVTGRWG